MTPLQSRLVLVLSLVLAVAGCNNKKPVASKPAQQTPPPVAEPSPTPTPAPQPAQTEQTQPQAQPESEAPKQEQATAPAKPNKSKPSPRKIIVDENKTTPQSPPGQISPGISQTDAQHDQAATEQLLQNTEIAVSGIKRQLSDHEQAMLAQIRDFITQSRKAISENDQVRARTFAMKAHLLSDALVKQR